MELPQIDNYQQIFLHDTPLIDVRAPIEYQQGAFPQAKNLPLMNDDERQNIGICYKKHGQSQAIALGKQLVSGKTKQARIEHWAQFVQHNPSGMLYCFRGGLRSKITQRWVYEQTGVMYPRVTGGYKALRRFLIEQLDSNINQVPSFILGGRTGVGKTLLLKNLQHKIDLENIYQHRGSAFGKHPQPQPSQIDIENCLSIELLKCLRKNPENIVLEDEARSIGSRRVPDSVASRINQSPLVLLEADVDVRVDIIFKEYIVETLKDFQLALGHTNGFSSWAENLNNSLDRIQRRLGGDRYHNIKNLLANAIIKHQQADDLKYHKYWIQKLLVDYYDPMYDYQLAKKTDRIIFRGNNAAVEQYLKSLQQRT